MITNKEGITFRDREEEINYVVAMMLSARHLPPEEAAYVLKHPWGSDPLFPDYTGPKRIIKRDHYHGELSVDFDEHAY